MIGGLALHPRLGLQSVRSRGGTLATRSFSAAQFPATYERGICYWRCRQTDATHTFGCSKPSPRLNVARPRPSCGPASSPPLDPPLLGCRATAPASISIELPGLPKRPFTHAGQLADDPGHQSKAHAHTQRYSFCVACGAPQRDGHTKCHAHTRHTPSAPGGITACAIGVTAVDGTQTRHFHSLWL